MAAVGRLVNPRRLLSFGIKSCWEKAACRKKKTNTKITIDAEKSITKTPDVELVDEPHTASEEDAP